MDQLQLLRLPAVILLRTYQDTNALTQSPIEEVADVAQLLLDGSLQLHLA